MLALAFAGAPADAADVAIEAIRLDVAAPQAAPLVTGELRIPRDFPAPLPAVLILHGSGGVDGRGASYARELNDAGIATLEIDMFQGAGRPQSTRFTMPHAYASLARLADDPRIDARRIGVMGFSWGAIMALLTSTTAVSDEFAKGPARFRAHLALYPSCWSQRDVIAGKAAHFRRDTYARPTGSPVHILAGGQDDYDTPDACAKLIEELPAAARQHFALTVYPHGTHIWDGAASGAFHDRYAHSGKGGMVRTVADPALAAKSRRFAVEFFTQNLARSTP